MIFISIVLLFFVCLYFTFEDQLFPDKIPAYTLLLLLLLIFINPVNVILRSWNIRTKKFNRNTSPMVAGTLMAKGSVIGVGTSFLSSGTGLLVGDFIKEVFTFFTQSSIKRKKILLRSFLPLNFNELKSVFKRNANTPKYIFPSQFINKLTGDLPIIIIGAFYTTEMVGYYTFSTTLLNLPKKLIANALQPVFYQKANELYQQNKKQLSSFTLKIFNFSIIFLVIPITFITIFSSVIFPLFFWISMGNGRKSYHGNRFSGCAQCCNKPYREPEEGVWIGKKEFSFFPYWE